MKRILPSHKGVLVKQRDLLLLASGVLALMASPLQAEDLPPFPPITAEERALTAVPGELNAPAVVLFKKGEFQVRLDSYEYPGRLRIQARVKILTEEGKRESEIVVAHSYAKLQNFEGRTVLPDGRVVSVGQEAEFVRKTSRRYNANVTAVVFPAVEVGAILDYRYEMLVDLSRFLDPWYFSETVPVRYAEMLFKTRGIRSRLWSRTTLAGKVDTESRETRGGFEVKAWTADLPSVPDDPYGPPFQDLAVQVRLLPLSEAGDHFFNGLYESWPKACELAVISYEQARRRDMGLREQARGIAGSGTPRQKTQSLYRFVRDQIQIDPSYDGIYVDSRVSLRKLLSSQRAQPAEKALLLQAMLEEVGIGSRLVWARDRSRGSIDPKLINPLCFNKVLVAPELEGERTFLDPSDRALGFGQLPPGYEAAQALIPDRNKPEWIALPTTSHDQSVRRAEIALALDAKGRLWGKGSLVLTGHRAFERIDWQERDAAARLQVWKNWLAEKYRDFKITDVQTLEAPDERKVTVIWSLAQREEEFLDDEVTLMPSMPLGPIQQPFVQPASSRKTAVVFDFPYRDEVDLRLRWPEGWNVDFLPSLAAFQNQVGALTTASSCRREIALSSFGGGSTSPAEPWPASRSMKRPGPCSPRPRRATRKR